MHQNTQKKIIALRNFIVKNHEKLVKQYPDIVGVHIGQKTRNGKSSGRYALVFHVEKKRKHKAKQKDIPKFFRIKIDKNPVLVPTDVIESGKPKLSGIGPGSKVFHRKFPSSFGSASVFLTDNTDVYLLTNMHVIGKPHLRNAFEAFDIPHDFGKAEIFCELGNADLLDMACFKSGAVDNFVDAAIAVINPLFHQIVENTIDGVPITGAGKVDLSVASAPKEIIIKGAVSGKLNGIVITSNTAVRTFQYPRGGMTLFDLLQISPCKTQGGDSGSPIIDPSTNQLLGIVLGKDQKNTFTYGIPIDRILDFFALKILNPSV